jgi:hypothetical protein
VRPLGAVPSPGRPPRTALPHCHGPYKFGDPCHLLACVGAPPAFAAARSAALGRAAALEARGGPVKLLCNPLVGESTQVPALSFVGW